MRRIILLGLALLLCSCTYYESFEVQETRELMGTFVTITVYDLDKGAASRAVEEAFSEISRIESIMSENIVSSEVYSLNARSFLKEWSADLRYVLEESAYYSNISGGAFDITVKPLLDLYSKSFEELKRPPTDDEIKETLILVNYKNIIINDVIAFRNGSMKITFGGIAKGYAIDRAAEVLVEHGIEHALVNAGGDMRAIGAKTENEGWNIALENPRDKDEFITLIDLDNKSVATSGDYERYYDSDKQFHHIVNPKTGYSATELISVTIIADDAISADAIATSVFVLGEEKGLELIESLSDVEGLIITSEREIVRSRGFEY